VRPGIAKPGEARTDLEIFAQLANRLGRTVSYTGPAAIFAELASGVPGYAGIEFNAIGSRGVVWGGENLEPATRKVVPVAGGTPASGPYQLVTGSALYHSGTVSTRAKGPLAVVPEPYVELGSEDANALGVEDGDPVTVKSGGVELKLKAKVGKRLPKGVLFAPYHFPEAELNRLYKGEAAVAVDVSK